MSRLSAAERRQQNVGSRTSAAERRQRETLESVSSCTRFSGFLEISSFGFNRLNSKLVGMLFGIVSMLVSKDFVPDSFVAQIGANSGAHAHFGAYLRNEAIPNKFL